MASCNEDPLDPTCYCNPRYGRGSTYRVQDLSSGKYVCCGNVNYNGSFDEICGVCTGWAVGLLDTTKTYAASNYGPDVGLTSRLSARAAMAAVFPLPFSTDNIGYTCHGGHVPRYVKYLNLNQGATYEATVACIPYGDGYIGQGYEPWVTGDFALYLIRGCDTDTTINSNQCAPLGAVGDPNNIGAQDYRSQNYRGPNNNETGNGDAPQTIAGMPPWLFWTLLAIIIILLIAVIGLSVWKTTATKLITISQPVPGTQPAPIIQYTAEVTAPVS